MRLAVCVCLLCTCILVILYLMRRLVVNLHFVFAELADFGKLQSRTIESLPTYYVKFIRIPKRLFYQFYLFGSISNIFYLSVLLLAWYYRDGQASDLLPRFVTAMIHNMNIDVQSISIWKMPDSAGIVILTSPHVLLVILLICVQCVRRLYECVRVSVYNPDMYMHLVHYLLGVVYYQVMTPMILADVSAYNSYSSRINNHSRQPVFRVICLILGVSIFTFASILQHQSAQIFANLRKHIVTNEDSMQQSVVIHTKHSIPYGGLFQYVSCPHFLAEILIYIALYIILCGGGAVVASYPLFLTFVIFTIFNQSAVAYSTHLWYRDTFGDKYPRHRRALLPYIF